MKPSAATADHTKDNETASSPPSSSSSQEQFVASVSVRDEQQDELRSSGDDADSGPIITSTIPHTLTTPLQTERKVRFNERCKLRFVPVPKKKEMHARWYENQDYDKFKAECHQVASLADRFGIHNVEATGALTCWGIEFLISAEGKSNEKKKQRRRKLAMTMALDEQEQYWKSVNKTTTTATQEQRKDGRMLDTSSKIVASYMRSVSSRYSKEAHRMGRLYAMDDTLLRYYLEDCPTRTTNELLHDIDLSTTTTTRNSASSKIMGDDDSNHDNISSSFHPKVYAGQKKQLAPPMA